MNKILEETVNLKAINNQIEMLKNGERYIASVWQTLKNTAKEHGFDTVDFIQKLEPCEIFYKILKNNKRSKKMFNEEIQIPRREIFDQENAEQILQNEIKDVMLVCNCKEEEAMNLIEKSLLYSELLEMQLKNNQLSYEEYQLLFRGVDDVEDYLTATVALCIKKLSLRRV